VTGARNVISANDRSGVLISGSRATENRVEGNYIGTGADSTGNLGNTENGVWIFIGANFTTVGGTANGAGNRIAHNGADGVSISDSATASNNVLSNTIFNNDELGIDLAGGTEDANGVTANDTDDPDTGANNLQNKPTISSATTASGKITVKGNLNSTPEKTFTIQFFSNRSGENEGRTFIGQRSVSTNANGKAPFTFSFPKEVLVGRTVTATATGPGGNTSEFSVPRTVVAQ
jgi:hypothetical protein